MRRAIVAAVLAITVGLGATPTMAGGPTGSISGTVFEDTNANGVMDSGESGLPNTSVKVEQAGTVLGYVRSHDDGTYAMPLSPGDYTLTGLVLENGGGCADYFFTFNPTTTSYCIHPAFPWNSTPDPVQVTVTADSSATVDFPARPADAAVLAGVALLEDGLAPAGTPIEALVDGVECGTTTILSGNVELNYVLTVLGAGERPGCAGPGDDVQFRVGGVIAGETYSFTRFADYQRLPTTFTFPQLQPLSAMQDRSWYWLERRGPGLNTSVVGASALAFIDGTVCAETTLQGATNRIGFSRLIVESESLHAGCGRPDATVTFRVGGVRALEEFPWEPRLRRLELTLYGDADCDLVVDAVDSALLLQFSAVLVASLPCEMAADANSDGSINAIDATLDLQFGAGLLTTFPPE